MAVQIGKAPERGFEDPVGMLKDCHRRIEHFSGVLQQVIAAAQGRSLTQPEQQAAEAALMYFQHSGPRHNQDEELSLFPRLRACVSGEDAQTIHLLIGQHAEADELQAQAKRLLMQWIETGSLTEVERNQLIACVQSLAAHYAEHIRVEESVIFPLTSNLDSAAITAMGQEFRSRRQG